MPKDFMPHLFNLQIIDYYLPVKNCKPFSLDAGLVYYYYGDLKGAFALLLQTQCNALPNVKFQNFPSDTLFVYFHGYGIFHADTKGGGIDKSQKTWYNNNDRASDSREIVLKTLAANYGVVVDKTTDSLDVYAFQLQDSTKLYNHKIKYSDDNPLFREHAEFNRPFARQIWLLAFTFEKMWKIYVEDESNTHNLFDRFLFQIPSYMFESANRYPELKKYLEKNYGLTMIKRKELRPVYTISLRNP